MLVLYLYTWILPFPLFYSPPYIISQHVSLFFGMIILVKIILLCRGMAWLPFQKYILEWLHFPLASIKQLLKDVVHWYVRGVP